MLKTPENTGAVLDAPSEKDESETVLQFDESTTRQLGTLALYEDPRVGLQSDQLVIYHWAYDFNTEPLT